MKSIHLAACISSLAILSSVQAQAQETPAADPNAPEGQVAPTSAEEWAQFSSNDRTIYLIDMKSFKPVGDATAVRVARVPTQGTTSALVHRIDEYEIRCRQNQARMMVEVEFDDRGNEVERYPEADAEWDSIRPTSLPGYFKDMTCNNARPQEASFPSIKAFIENGRK